MVRSHTARVAGTLLSWCSYSIDDREALNESSRSVPGIPYLFHKYDDIGCLGTCVHNALKSTQTQAHDDGRSGTMMNANWYAVYVKSRHEFVVSGELQSKGIETFLPSVITLNQWKDRKKHIKTPLFPGYVFVSIQPDPEEFVRVVKTRGAVSFIAMEPGHPSPVDPAEINALKILLESGEQIDIHPHFKLGARVRVKSGVFRGATGTLARKDDHHVLFVSIEILGRSVGVKIYADDVEAA